MVRVKVLPACFILIVLNALDLLSESDKIMLANSVSGTSLLECKSSQSISSLKPRFFSVSIIDVGLSQVLIAGPDWLYRVRAGIFFDAKYKEIDTRLSQASTSTLVIISVPLCPHLSMSLSLGDVVV